MCILLKVLAGDKGGRVLIFNHFKNRFAELTPFLIPLFSALSSGG